MLSFRINVKDFVIESCAFVLIFLFTYVTTSKLADIPEFRQSLNNQPLDNKFTPALMVVLPFVEYMTAILLFFNKTRLLGFISSTILLVIFTTYIVLVLSNHFDRIPCSCGGITQYMTWNQHLLFNTIFIFISILGLILTFKMRNTQTSGLTVTPSVVQPN